MAGHDQQRGAGDRRELLAIWGRMSPEERTRLLEHARIQSRSKPGPMVKATEPSRARAMVVTVLVILALYGVWRADSIREAAIAARDGIAGWSRGLLDFDRNDDEAATQSAPRKQPQW
jgi:hypothetical protein